MNARDLFNALLNASLALMGMSMVASLGTGLPTAARTAP